MNNKEALEIFEHDWTRLVNPNYSYIELGQAQDLAIKALEERPQGEDIPFTLSYCPTCGNRMWGYENGKIVCAVCGNTMADTIADKKGGAE